MLKKLELIAVFLLLGNLVFSQLISNGGFENGLTDWSTQQLNGSAATFTLSSTEVHSGTKRLEVKVNTNGSVSNSVVLTSKPFATSSERIYMVRFWARSAQADSRIVLTLKGSTTNSTCEFKVYDAFDTWKNGWQMYQYLFKTTDSELELLLSFNSVGSYFIDDIELIDDTHPVLDLKTQLMWQNNLTGYGWASGDNDVSVALPDGRTAWIFSDSFLGWPNPSEHYLREGTMINNLIVEESTDGKLTTIYNGTQSQPRTLVTSPSGNVYWVGDGIIEDGKLRVIYNEWRGLDYNNSAGVATISLSTLKPERTIVTSYKGPYIPNALLQDGDYIYIYLEARSGLSRNTRIARVPAGALHLSRTAWEFYSISNTWVSDYTKAKTMIPAPAASVRKLGEGNYVMSAVPNLSREFALWFAPTPYGPWGNKKVIYTMPAEEGVLFYLGHIHERPESASTGVYTLSCSVYPFGGYVPQQKADKGTYLPIYLKANLKELSPFTDKTSVRNPNGTERRVKLYPNPALNQLRFAGSELMKSIEIFNFVGVKVAEETSGIVDVTRLQPGLYVAKVVFEDYTEEHSFIKE